MVPHALSFDIECFYQCAALRFQNTVRDPHEELIPATHYLLEELARTSTQATFFVLGNVAKRFPWLIRLMAEGGHEIGVHGNTHQPVNRLSAARFRDELRAAKDSILAAVPDARLLGHRGPNHSITYEMGWAFDVLREEGFLYDSTGFPTSDEQDRETPAEPFRLPNGLHEVPLGVAEILGLRLPALGGGYVRYPPFFYTEWTLREYTKRGRGAVLYFHPYEFALTPVQHGWILAAGSAAGAARCVLYQMRQRFGRGAPMREKLRRLLRENTFVSVLALLRRCCAPTLEAPFL